MPVFASSGAYYLDTQVKKAGNVQSYTISWNQMAEHMITSYGQEWLGNGLANSGCGYCAAASIVRAYGIRTNSYKKSPSNIYSRAKKLSGNSPSNLGVYGMANVFDYYGVNYKLYYRYPKSKQMNLVYNHLKKGGMVVMWTCKSGLGNYRYHSVVLAGLTQDGDIVVVNSAIGKKRFQICSKSYIWDQILCANDGSKLYYTSAKAAKKAYNNTYVETGERGIFLIG